jgi:hypothetical protein
MNNNMRDFTAAYEYQEYPKWVTLADGSQIVVNNAAEEDVALGELTDVPADERESLMAEAKALGLTPHHRTGADKLREMIASAKG